MIVWACGGCEGAPARPKPWRHVETPTWNPRPDGQALPGAAAARVRERADEAARRARTLTIRLEAEPTHLHPLIEPEQEGLRVVFDTIYETLIRYEPSPDGGPGVYRPGLAESFRVSADGRQIRLRLRRDVKFHDGSAFTALDAQWAIDAARLRMGRSPRLRQLLGAVASADVWGPRDLRIELRRPDAYVLRALAEVPIVPHHLTGQRDALRRAPVGTGPYRLARWRRGDAIELERHADYWGRAPAIPAVHFVIDPDGARALVRAKLGEIDVVPELIPEHWPEQPSVPAVARDFDVLRLAPPRLRAIALNARKSPFEDARVRAAAVLLVDRDRIARDVHRGLARPIAGPVWPGGPGDGDAPPPPPFDPHRAAALLDEAGWRDGDGNGVRERGEAKLHIVFLATSGRDVDAEREVIVGALRKIGFVVDVRIGDPGFLHARLRDGQFDAAVVEWRGRVDDDLRVLLGERGAYNWGGFSSPEVEAALDALAGAWEPAARAPLAGALARVLVKAWPMVPLVADDPRGLVSARVRGLVVRDGWFAIRDLSFRPEAGARVGAAR